MEETPELLGRRVLVVDDNATNRRIITLQLQRWGMQVHATGSPKEALEWVHQGETLDLAILDLQMPEMDGIELAWKIREAKGRSVQATSQPLVLLSSLGSYGREIPESLFSACLNKPIRASVLFEALMNIFAGQPGLIPAGTTVHVDAGMAQKLPLSILLAEDHVQRTLERAHRQVALALVEGQALTLEGSLIETGPAGAQRLEHTNSPAK